MFLGSLLGSTSPVATFTELVGAEIHLDAGSHLNLAVDPTFEHGILVDTGSITVEGTAVQRTELAYTGTGSSVIHLSNTGDSTARLVLLGGTPFEGTEPPASNSHEPPEGSRKHRVHVRPSFGRWQSRCALERCGAEGSPHAETRLTRRESRQGARSLREDGAPIEAASAIA